MSIHARHAALTTVLTAALVGTWGCTPKRTDSGTATVTTRAGQPCFSVEDRADTRGKALSLAYVQVVDAAGVQVWDAQFREGSRIAPTDCIVFGLRTSQMSHATPPGPLLDGRGYRVVIMAPVPDQPSVPHGYTANFCMSTTGPAPLGASQAASCDPSRR